MHLSDDWNLISRTIIPLVSQPNPFFDSNTNGIGDITQSLFFSPTHPGKLIWGVGPVFTIPSANDPILGTGKFLFGPTAVFLTTPGHWVIGVLLNNQWSVGGNPLRPPVNTFLAQPFLNYNMAHGWYLTTGPIITSNWLAASGQQWTVPVGGGFGRVFRVGDQPVNASIQAITTRYVRPALRPGNCGLLSRSCSLSNDRAAGRAICTIRFGCITLSTKGDSTASLARSRDKMPKVHSVYAAFGPTFCSKQS